MQQHIDATAASDKIKSEIRPVCVCVCVCVWREREREREREKEEEEEAEEAGTEFFF
jgi:hypothetical protein